MPKKLCPKGRNERDNQATQANWAHRAPIVSTVELREVAQKRVRTAVEI
jgi:hypothetical protein